jgi:hypothetical protein
MISFETVLLQFEKQGEKTGWTYFDIDVSLAEQLKPNNRQSFRVKGFIDNTPFQQVAVMPMGAGHFIFPVNADLRRASKRKAGMKVKIKIEVDDTPFSPSAELMDCIEDLPEAKDFFLSLTLSHQRYFTNWIDSAKTDATKAKRIAMAINAFINKWGYPEMVRANKVAKDNA